MSFVFESRLVGSRENSVQDVIYGYLTWKNSMNDIFKHELGSKKLFWTSHERGSYGGVIACPLFSNLVWSVQGKILYKMSYIWVPKLEKKIEWHF